MKIGKLFIIVFVLISIIFSLPAQNTSGTEFWLTFGSISILQANDVELQFRIVNGNTQTKGKIHFTNLGTDIDFSLNPHQIFDHSLDPIQRQAVYNTTMGVSNLSVRIISDDPVNVYIRSRWFGFNDATNILPILALGTEYYQASYYPTLGSGIQNDAFAIVSTQNNTQIYHNGIPISEGLLSAGQVYYHLSNSDMTGTYITSNNPVAFFALNTLARIPPSSLHTSCLTQQLASVNTWGREFLVPVSHINPDRVRIVASKNGTNIIQTGATIQTGVPGAQTNLIGLQAGQFVELELISGSNGCFIQANYPIGVCSYFTAISGVNNTVSAPAQCWVPAKEQLSNKVLIAPFIPYGQNNIQGHRALVVTQTATKDETKVSIASAPPDNLSGGSWIDNAVAGMSYYNMPLTNDTASYLFTNQKGLIIFIYGYGQMDTYYYLGGSAMRDLYSAFYANGIHFQDLKDNQFCQGEVEFQTEIEGMHPTHPNRLTWWIDGVEYLPAKNLEQWSKPFTIGEYEIEMKVIYENDETATKTGFLNIINCNTEAAFYVNNVHHSVLQDTLFCDKNVNFRAEIEGLSSESGSLKWFINGVEETNAQDRLTWSKQFETGIYEIKMVVVYDNGETETITSTLKMEVFWVKMRNVRH